MRRLGWIRFLFTALMVVSVSPARATNYGAMTDGDWSAAGIWTPSGGPPGSGDAAFVGSNTPSGTAATAVVTLDSNQQAGNVYLGFGSGGIGTLDLAEYSLALNGTLAIGSSGASGNILRGSGFFDTNNLTVLDGNSLIMAASDRVNQNVSVAGTGQLTLNAPLALTYDLDIRNGGTVDLNSYDISVKNLILGQNGAGFSLINDGAITVSDWTRIKGTDFTFDANDSTSHLSVSDAAVTLDPATQLQYLTLGSGSATSTINATSVNQNVTVDGTGQLMLNAPLALTYDLDIRNGGTVDLNSQDISVRHLKLGQNGAGFNLINDGAITVSGWTYIKESDFTFDVNDSTCHLSVSDATVALDLATQLQYLTLGNGGATSTINPTSVNQNVTVAGTGQLTLNAPLALTYDLDIRNGGTVDLNSQDISVKNLKLGQNGAGFSLINDGAITVSDWTRIKGTDFTFDANDSTSHLSVSDATVTLDPVTQLQYLTLSNSGAISTLNPTSVNQNVTVDGTGQMTLNAALALTFDLDIRNGGTVDLNSHDISVKNLKLGQNGAGFSLVNDGAITVSDWTRIKGTDFTFDANDSTSHLSVSDAAVTLDPATQLQYLTLGNGGAISTLNPTSVNQNVTVDGTGQMVLNAALALTYDLDIRNGGTVDLNSHDISVKNLKLGQNGAGFSLINDGAITVSDWTRIKGTDFTFDANDSTSHLSVSDAAVTLDPATQLQYLTLGNGGAISTLNPTSVNQNVTVDGTGQMALNAALALTYDLDIRNGGTVDLNSHDISVKNLKLGQNGAGFSLRNDGAVTAVNLYANGGSTTLTDGDDVITNSIQLRGGSVLTSHQDTGDTRGLTLLGDSLHILDTSVLNLSFDTNPGGIYLDCAFRWANAPGGADRVAEITNLIEGGQIAINFPTDIRVFDYIDGFTYVGVGEYPADFDEDGDVDNVDLGMWQTGFGTIGTALHTDGDADQDQDVDGTDFLIWQVQNGLIASPVSSRLTVPEPCTCFLLSIMVMGHAIFRRKKHVR